MNACHSIFRGLARLATATVGCFWLLVGVAEESPTPSVFTDSIQPLLRDTCFECHSTSKHKGDLDLERFTSIESLRHEPKVWEEVAAQVATGEMPPRDAKLPKPVNSKDRTAFLQGVNEVLDEVAATLAGDPGAVVLRRLSNAEYTYTIRDLTGLPSLNPVREFPTDGASGEGFMNVGNSLVMSSALVSKYLDAAKSVAAHALLLPDGIRFSPSITVRDWTDDYVRQIREVYGRYSDAHGGDTVNLQGIVFSTNEGGRLPIERYLAVSLEFRDGYNDERIQRVAQQQSLSPRYLELLVRTLSSTQPSLLLDPIRTVWRSARKEDLPKLVGEISLWQKALWKFSSVGHIGKLGGPKSWMEPVTPLASLQEFRVKLAPTNQTQAVTVYFVAGDAGDGNGQDYIVWERPRLVVPGQPEVMLRSISGSSTSAKNPGPWGLEASRFGHDPEGNAIEADSLMLRAPAVLEARIPAELAAGAELVATARLASRFGDAGSVQFQILTNKPVSGNGLWETGAQVMETGGVWTSEHRRLSLGSPIVVSEGSETRNRYEKDMEDFRQVFPAALCYTKIVPVDEVVTLTLFYREDEYLSKLMLNDGERAQLDRLWNELHFVSRDALTLVDGFEQLWQFATQDADPKVFEPLREPIQRRAGEFRAILTNAQPRHVDAVVAFASRAYRRPTTDAERTEIRNLYETLRAEDLSHEEAVRLTLARVLVAPAFLYHAESPVAGKTQGPISNLELANRLSYFLTSSGPDAELRAVAESGKLMEIETLRAQSRRLLRDSNVRRLAIEFGCAWLHLYGFDDSAEKSERLFPTFAGLRSAMYEETVDFITDFFQQDRPLLELLDGDATFLNEALAKHYGIEGITGPEWRRVQGMKSRGRGGLLGQASVLAQQSGASRTSPILRGNWVSEVLLGEKLPRPPKDVPRLPEEENTASMTVRELTQAHSSDPRCAGCHIRIDGFGFALEGFDAVGKMRDHDLGNRMIDTRATLQDGVTIEGMDGLRKYLVNQRRDAFVTQFCRKLLGYALGRSVQLSDRPLLAEMRKRLAANDYRVSAAVEAVVESRQFREIRGREFVATE